MKTSQPPSSPAPRATGPRPGAPSQGPGGGRALALPSALALALVAFGLLFPRTQVPELFWTFAGAGSLLVAWAAALHLAARASGRRLTLDVAIYRHHWVQACAQFSVFLWWGWHVRFVYAYFPLLFAQLVFAYAVDALLSWSRRDRYSLGFGPFPIVFSINLFLWYRPEYFHWQLAMIAVGYLAKEFIRWEKDGRSAHIFNPSSFPLALSALVLILTGTSEVTLARQIVTSQFQVPYIYLVIFLAALPGQLLFGVARMTMTAVVTLVCVSVLFFQATGTFLFLDAHIPVPVFLGMHLLFTDPSTSPRSGPGRVLFGVLYALGVAFFFVVLDLASAPTYFDKLLPLPILNLLVRRIDALTAVGPLSRASLSRLVGAATPARRHLFYTSLWATVFLGLSATGAVGDRHPGQYLPFWQEACRDGNGRACAYLEYRLSLYCAQGSGWACNEWGISLAEVREPARGAFQRGCRLGFGPACENARQVAAAPGGLARAEPPLRELPVILSWKGRVRERDPAALYAIACEQGWPGTCARAAP